jgi:predicted ATPase
MSNIRLVGIEVSGFRAFQAPYEVSFRSPLGDPTDVVVIAGPNGSGKSSLLEAVLIAMGRERLIRNSLSRESDADHWRTTIPDIASIVLTFHIDSAPGTELGAYAPCDVRVLRTGAEWRLELLGGGEGPIRLSDLVRRQFVDERPIEYLSSWRTPFQLGGVRLSTLAGEAVEDERYRLYRLKQRIISERAKRAFSTVDASDQRWLDRLNDTWRDWHDSDGTWIDVIPTREAERPYDLFILRDTPEMGPQPICELDRASSGELEWVTLAGQLIVDEFDGLLLIDEPELHLHPQWQARLLPTLRKLAPKAQILVATHSAYPWDQALPFQRVLLLPANDPRRREEGS